jgi:hypothetical protein
MMRVYEHMFPIRLAKCICCCGMQGEREGEEEEEKEEEEEEEEKKKNGMEMRGYGSARRRGNATLAEQPVSDSSLPPYMPSR